MSSICTLKGAQNSLYLRPIADIARALTSLTESQEIAEKAQQLHAPPPPFSSCSLSLPLDLTPELTTLGLRLEAAKAISDTYRKAVERLRDQYEQDFDRTYRSCIEASLRHGCAVPETQSRIILVYSSQFCDAAKRWADKGMASTRHRLLLNSLKNRMHISLEQSQFDITPSIPERTRILHRTQDMSKDSIPKAASNCSAHTHKAVSMPNRPTQITATTSNLCVPASASPISFKRQSVDTRCITWNHNSSIWTTARHRNPRAFCCHPSCKDACRAQAEQDLTDFPHLRTKNIFNSVEVPDDHVARAFVPSIRRLAATSVQASPVSLPENSTAVCLRSLALIGSSSLGIEAERMNVKPRRRKFAPFPKRVPSAAVVKQEPVMISDLHPPHPFNVPSSPPSPQGVSLPNVTSPPVPSALTTWPTRISCFEFTSPSSASWPRFPAPCTPSLSSISSDISDSSSQTSDHYHTPQFSFTPSFSLSLES